MSMTDWSTAELDAEITDIRETMEHLAGSLREAETALMEQIGRSTEVYGARSSWPAGSEHAVRQLEQRLSDLTERRYGCSSYLGELVEQREGGKA